ncbi:RNA ligase RtcB family protein [Undibacterium terreum]|uniref:3'-phosphate/5'-hydroxy nucleic acid ligase n=1 Tax=Undibacterium terreum TaxID=1224302 RepID=A0A916XDI4_9BURK|nr:RNA ligase RtcB family protein [Undibacterium terreum]GGC63721.1 RtcB family protein [Undibacterium terreum]
MGNFIRHLSDRVSVIASDRLWLEDAALQQLKTTAELPGMLRVVGLPDLHPGRGYPVGAAFFSKERFYPALVGNDIGCGMGLWQTDIVIGKLKLDKLDRQLGNLDSGIDAEEWSALEELDLALNMRLEALKEAMGAAGLDIADLRSLGTIGGGNHFAELQVIDQVHDEKVVCQAGLQQKQVQLLVHSGSRGLGQAILREHVDAVGHAGLRDASDEATAYLRRHDAALQFARLNRQLIAMRFFRRLHCSADLILDVHHNLVSKEDIAGEAGWLHRKGASPADKGLVMLPGSRGDYSYLMQPVNAHADTSLASLAHGAGRKWQRSDCKDRLYKLATPAQLERTILGSRVICEDRALIYEEAPQAYKNVDSVLNSLLGAGLVRVLTRSKPVLTYKTRGECC